MIGFEVNTDIELIDLEMTASLNFARRIKKQKSELVISYYGEKQ